MSQKNYKQTEAYMKLPRHEIGGWGWRDQKNLRLDYLISSFLKFLQPEDRHNDLVLVEILHGTYGQHGDLLHPMVL